MDVSSQEDRDGYVSPPDVKFLTFVEYQGRAAETAQYPKLAVMEALNTPASGPIGWIYPALGLAGETGELVDKLKKILRDQNGKVGEFTREAICRELGDILWYVAMLAKELDLELDQVAQVNLDKLADRKQRGVLGGTGDDR